MSEILRPDVLRPEAHQNYRSNVRELNGPTFDLLRKNFAWWAIAQRTSYGCQNRGRALARDFGAVARSNNLSQLHGNMGMRLKAVNQQTLSEKGTSSMLLVTCPNGR